MSMRDYPNSGYVVPLESLKPLLTPENQTKFDELLADNEREELEDFLNDNLPDTIPYVDVYCPSDEDNVDDPMQQGGYYAIFDEDDLYEKIETPQHTAMKKLGITPQFTQWTTWG